MRPDAPKPSLLLPGSFNPLHAGHLGLAKIASEFAGAPAAFDLSVLNADKPPLADEEVRRRLDQFAWRAPVWLTRAPTYAEKAELFPGCVFVVGADTAARVVQPRFYQDSEGRMAGALDHLRPRLSLPRGRPGRCGRPFRRRGRSERAAGIPRSVRSHPGDGVSRGPVLDGDPRRMARSRGDERL